MYRYVWLEVRYGNPDKGGTLLSRIWSRELLRQAKGRLLEDSDDKALFSELKDDIQGLIARSEHDKLRLLLDKLLPDNI